MQAYVKKGWLEQSFVAKLAGQYKLGGPITGRAYNYNWDFTVIYFGLFFFFSDKVLNRTWKKNGPLYFAIRVVTGDNNLF